MEYLAKKPGKRKELKTYKQSGLNFSANLKICKFAFSKYSNFPTTEFLPFPLFEGYFVII